MSSIVTLSSSPSSVSRTDAVLSHVTHRLVGAGHQVTSLVLRDLPAGALLAGDTGAPQIAAAVAALADADAVVVATPVYKAAYSGLLKVFLDLLPQYALRGKAVLPLATGGTPAHVLAVDYALRPVLTSLGASHVSQGWFVLAQHVRLFPGDGGVLLDPAASGPLLEVTDAFLRSLDGQLTAPGSAAAGAAGTPTLQVLRVGVGHPAAVPLLADLVVEYGTRYGLTTPNTQLTEVAASDFEAPGGAFLVLQDRGETVAGGALRRYDDETAEVKRVWTSHRRRRQGLGRRVLHELEEVAAELGYRRIHLTTGPRQPEAAALYRSAGYTELFDSTADPETIGPLPFAKELGHLRQALRPTLVAEAREAPEGTEAPEAALASVARPDSPARAVAS